MLNRKQAPAFQKTLSLSLPDPVEIDLPSGNKIFWLQGIHQNVAKIEIVFSAGKWAESRVGLSHFTSMMLEKGTVKKTSDEIAEILDSYGASLEISPGFDFVSISLYSLKVKLQDILPVFLEILTAPAFPEKEWLQMQDIFLQTLKINNEKTSYQASKFIRQNIFGKTHPYGSAIDESDAKSLRVEDFRSFFQSAFTVRGIYVVGNLSPAEIGLVEQGMALLPAEKETRVIHALPAVLPFSQEENKEGRVQASVRLAKRSLLRTDAEYPDVLLSAYLLGGFFGSRLMKNIREEKGLTYGISASLNTFIHDGLFMIGADVNRENASLVIVEIKKEIEQLMTVCVPDQELQLAKNHFTGSLQTDIANLFSVQEKIKSIHLNGLQKNHYQHLLQRIDAITPEGIRATAGKYFDPKTLFGVVVG